MHPGTGLLSQTFTASTSAILAAQVILRDLLTADLFGPHGRNMQVHAHFTRRFDAIARAHPDWLRGPYGLGAMIACTPFDGSEGQVRKLLHALFANGVIAFFNGENPARLRFLPPVPVLTGAHIDTVCDILETTLAQVARACEEAPMLIIRPVRPTDLEGLLGLAALTGFGLTTLPRDRDLLAERIDESEHSFSRMAQRPRGESYLFVMVDAACGQRVVGTCGITSKVGGFEPFYAYRIHGSTIASEMLMSARRSRRSPWWRNTAARARSARFFYIRTTGATATAGCCRWRAFCSWPSTGRASKPR